jgi:hypothetical protein
MLLIIALTALAAIAVASTVAALTNDGYRQIPTDRTRLP